MLAFGLIQATAASAFTRAGNFSCRGIALQLNGNSTSVSNAQGNPCRTDSALPVDVTVPLGPGASLRAIAVGSATQSNPNPTAVGTFPGEGHGGNAQAGVAGVNLKLPGLSLQLGAIRSLVDVVCIGIPNPPTMAKIANNDTVGLTINGKTIAVSGPLVLPLGTITIYLNRTIRTSGSLTQRAVEIDRLGQPPIIIGEAAVGFTGNPCALAAG